MSVIDGIDFRDYEEVEGLHFPVAYPVDEYEPPIVAYRNWCDPEVFLEQVLSEVGNDWSSKHVVEGRTAKVIDIEADEHPTIFARLEKPVLEANEQIGLDIRYWNNVCLNLLLPGGEHAGHSDYMPEAKLFFTLILKDADEGGQFYFVDTEEEYGAGDLVIFSAFMFHGVEPVEAGSRVSLTGWLGGPPIR